MRAAALKLETTKNEPQQAEMQPLEGEFSVKLRTLTDAAVNFIEFVFHARVMALSDIQQRQPQGNTVTNSKAYLTVQECAERYNFSQRTVRDWAAQRKIPHYKFNDEIRFDPAEIEAWAKRDINQ